MESNVYFFSPSYVQARERILAAADKLSIPHRVFSLPLGIPGREGEELCTDIIWLGSENPRRVMFHSSGVHGVEGYAGSAVQLQFLSQVVSPELPDDTAIVFIHAVNPFGMSWLRRANENNVDLNRNCLSKELWDNFAMQWNADYANFDEFLTPKEEPWNWTMNYWTQTAYYLSAYGFPSVKQTVAGGQYRFNKGLFYGGTEVQPGIQNILRFLKDHFSGAEHYVHVDFHTGLGPKGYDTLLVEGTEDDDWIQHLGDHVDRATDSSGTAYATKGSFLSSVFGIFSPKSNEIEFPFLNETQETNQLRKSTTKSCNTITQEFGTYPGPNVLKALREENFYYHKNCDASHWSRAAVLDTFWVKEPEWEESVLTRGKWLIDRALEFLLKK
jgi:hypothetical protein